MRHIRKVESSKNEKCGQCRSENQTAQKTARSLQSDLDLHCPQKLLVSSSVSKELRVEKKLTS